ncbi:MAG: hypothetical protein AAGD04_09535 [Pseudomonadota bacterium]
MTPYQQGHLLSSTGLIQWVERAARGARMPPAQAQHFARACLAHIVARRSEAEILQALETWQDHDCVSAPFRPATGSSGLAQSYRERHETPQTRVAVSKDLAEALERFACRTYVPASQTSRAGAGAGANDD